jgi:Mrp family chromosome partitioning ATPase
LTDEVILVVEADRTPKRTIIMAKDKIDAVKRRIDGIILNKQVNYVPDVIQNFINSL